MSRHAMTIAFCGLLIVAAVILLVIALGFEAKAIETRTPGTRFFPLLTLSTIIALSLALIAKEAVALARDRGASEDRIEIARSELGRVGLVVAAAIAGYYLWDLVGFLPMALGLIAATGAILKIRSWVAYVVMVAIIVGLYFVFRFLGIPLD